MTCGPNWKDGKLFAVIHHTPENPRPTELGSHQYSTQAVRHTEQPCGYRTCDVDQSVRSHTIDTMYYSPADVDQSVRSYSLPHNRYCVL